MRIPGFIKRNWRLKVGSVLIAFVTWVGVVYAGNPPTTRVLFGARAEPAEHPLRVRPREQAGERPGARRR